MHAYKNERRLRSGKVFMAFWNRRQVELLDL